MAAIVVGRNRRQVIDDDLFPTAVDAAKDVATLGELSDIPPPGFFQRVRNASEGVLLGVDGSVGRLVGAGDMVDAFVFDAVFAHDGEEGVVVVEGLADQPTAWVHQWGQWV